jgi:FAD binding domain-containing protein
MSAWHRLRVKAVVPEGNGVVSVLVESREVHELRAESGQFFRWRFLTPDLWSTAHPFSLSSAPTATELRLTVKALGDGSGRLRRRRRRLEAGTWVMAEGPYGAPSRSCTRNASASDRRRERALRHRATAGMMRQSAWNTRLWTSAPTMPRSTGSSSSAAASS